MSNPSPRLCLCGTLCLRRSRAFRCERAGLGTARLSALCCASTPLKAIMCPMRCGQIASSCEIAALVQCWSQHWCSAGCSTGAPQCLAAGAARHVLGAAGRRALLHKHRNQRPYRFQPMHPLKWDCLQQARAREWFLRAEHWRAAACWSECRLEHVGKAAHALPVSDLWVSWQPSHTRYTTLSCRKRSGN